MITKELVEYIKLETTKGTHPEDIKLNLVKNGWNVNDIAEARTEIAKQAPKVAIPPVPPVPPPPPAPKTL